MTKFILAAAFSLAAGAALAESPVSGVSIGGADYTIPFETHTAAATTVRASNQRIVTVRTQADRASTSYRTR
ncbi:MAG: hypothetical protein WCH83_12200 [Alphaproteobacteria bacterium]